MEVDHIECQAWGCKKISSSDPPLFCEAHASMVKPEVWRFLRDRYKGPDEKQTKEFQNVVRSLVMRIMWEERNDRTRTE